MKRAELSQFGKEFRAPERRQVLKDITEKRGEYFAVQQEVQPRLETVRAELLEKRASLEQVAADLARLQDEIDQKTQKTFSALINFSRIRTLRKEHGVKAQTEESLQAEIAEVEAKIQELQARLEDRTQLDAAQKLLEDWYEALPEEYEKHKEEERVRSVETIMQEKGVVFVHGIHPTFTPVGNSLLEKGVDWKTKLRVVLALEPTLSTSTIKEGDGPDRMWSRVGVVLAGGRVESAFSGDGGTQAKGLFKRNTTRVDGDQIRSQIDTAVQDRLASGYNELVVSKPRIAGVYLNTDQYQHTEVPDSMRSKDLVEIMKSFPEVPLYIMKGGVVFEGKFDEATQTLQPGERVSFETLEKNAVVLDEEEKARQEAEIFKEAPFDVPSPERSYFSARSVGQEFYVELSLDKVGALSGEKVSYKRDSKKDWGDVLGVNEIEIVARIPRAGSTVEIIKAEGYVYTRTATREGVHWRNLTRHMQESWNRDRTHIDLQPNFASVDLKRPLHSPEDYIAGMKEAIHEMRERMAKPGVSASEQEWRAQALIQEAYHLRGFATMAESMGDMEAAAQAKALAEEVVPDEDYQKFLAKRVGENGGYKLTKEDLM